MNADDASPPDHSPLTLRLYAAVLVALGLVPVANWLSAGHEVPW